VGFTAAVLAFFSLVRVGEGERVFRRSAFGGKPVRLAPGWRVRAPLLQRLERLPAGAFRAAGSMPLRSREGIALEIPFEISAGMDDAALERFLAGGGGDPAAALLSAAREAIASWGAERSGESLVLLEEAAAVEKAVGERIGTLGFDALVFHLGKARGPRDAIAAIEARALSGRASETGTKIAILGLDGADWEIIDPLIAAGQMPNLARLKARGAWGNLKTMTPTLSPLLWTSVATGKPPEQHGIIDFLVQESKTGVAVPVSSRWRKVKALWNIFTDVGRTSAFVAWWATWPAEPIAGTMVSDRVAYSLFGYEAGDQDRAGATHPAEYFKEIRPKIADDSQITLAEVQRFVRVSPEEFRALRQTIGADSKLAYREPVNHLTKILASARSYQAIALDILSRGQPDLFSVYYQGIDEVCHRFAHWMPPKMSLVTDEDYARYRDAVFAFHRYQDRLLGEVISRLSPNTTIVVLSDHGFMNGSNRPNEPPYIEGKPGLWHRRYGILIMAGPPIRPGRLDTTGLLDIAPTILYLSGLPVPEDMGGRVIREAIAESFKTRFPMRTISSYENIGRPLSETRVTVADSGVDEEMVEKLRSLGYVGGQAGAAGADRDGGIAAAAPDGQALVTGHLNEAGLHFKNKDYAKAERAVEEALATHPEFVSALILKAQILAAQKRYPPAIEALRKVIDLDPEGERGAYREIGRIYAESGRVQDGADHLGALARRHPNVAEIHSALGSMLLKAGKTEAAEKELLAALRLNPAAGDPLADLHRIYRGTERILTLEPVVRKGLAINDKSVVHRNWMGLILEWKKQIPEAEREYRRAMDLDPDYAATMANLGALYGRSGRLNEAVEILKRAVSKDPDNQEAWVNLGAALGRLGRSREAIEALETARRKGVRSTTLFNALALAYLQDRKRDKALEYLKESLSIDPGQKDANDLLRELSRVS
jgi:predicted AlkP superfamily phosphohydrolase/phosphomutase/tetratricopeptide (TPR) repeat protein